MFDELAIEPGLYNNQLKNFLEVFQGNGLESKAISSDTTKGFMVRAIHKKWKQSLVYNFNEALTKTEILVTSPSI